MRATQHNGRSNASGKTYRARHNDRQFDVSKAEHIEADKLQDNKIVKIFDMDNERGETLEEYELGFYERQFGAHQEAKNKRYKKQGHKERIKSIQELYNNKRYAPEEVILQLGKVGASATPEELDRAVKKYVNEFSKKYGSNIKILDYAIHNDEAVPHAHLRRVYVAKDKDGNLMPNESKALQELDFERPKKDKKEDRYNNRKVTFSAEDRQLYLDCCAITTQHQIERTPEKGKKRLKHEEYKLAKKQEQLNNVDAQIKQASNKMRQIQNKIKAKEDIEEKLDVAEYIMNEAPDVYKEIEEVLAMTDGDDIEISRHNIDIER